MDRTEEKPKCLVVNQEWAREDGTWFEIPLSISDSAALAIKLVLFYPGARSGGATDSGGDLLVVREWSKVGEAADVKWFVQFASFRGVSSSYARYLADHEGEDNFLYEGSHFRAFVMAAAENTASLPDLPRATEDQIRAIPISEAKKSIAKYHGLTEELIEIIVRV